MLRGFDPNLPLRAGQFQMQGQNSLFDSFFRAQQMQEQQRKIDIYEAEQEAARQRAEQAAQTNVDAILMKQQMGQPLTDTEQAALGAYNAKRGSEVMIDPTTGAQVQKYQPVGIAGGRMGTPEFERGGLGATMAGVSSGIMGSENENRLGKMVKEYGEPMGEKLQSGMDAQGYADTPKGRFELGKLEAERQFQLRKQLPQVQTKFRTLSEDVDNIDKTIDKAIGLVKKGAGGLSASGLNPYSWVSGTERDFSATMKTLQSDSALNRLTELKEQGGTLGAVSEKELELLTNARVALNEGQTEEQLKENLQRYRELRRQSLDRVAEAIKNEYGQYPKGYKAKGAENATIGKYRDGQVATNPTTGEKLIFKGGKWQKM